MGLFISKSHSGEYYSWFKNTYIIVRRSTLKKESWKPVGVTHSICLSVHPSIHPSILFSGEIITILSIKGSSVTGRSMVWRPRLQQATKSFWVAEQGRLLTWLCSVPAAEWDASPHFRCPHCRCPRVWYFSVTYTPIVCWAQTFSENLLLTSQNPSQKPLWHRKQVNNNYLLSLPLTQPREWILCTYLLEQSNFRVVTIRSIRLLICSFHKFGSI